MRKLIIPDYSEPHKTLYDIAHYMLKERPDFIILDKVEKIPSLRVLRKRLEKVLPDRIKVDYIAKCCPSLLYAVVKWLEEGGVKWILGYADVVKEHSVFGRAYRNVISYLGGGAYLVAEYVERGKYTEVDSVPEDRKGRWDWVYFYVMMPLEGIERTVGLFVSESFLVLRVRQE